MEGEIDVFWKKCSSCKKPIGFSTKYYICSVSTCNGQRTGYVFCSMPCFEVHLPGARHRDAGGIQQTSPSRAEYQQSQNPSNGVRRKIIPTTVSSKTTVMSGGTVLPRETLIVVSKLKDYINAKAGMNTSAAVIDILSDIVRRECDDAIDKARQEGRKTVLDRDFEKD